MSGALLEFSDASNRTDFRNKKSSEQQPLIHRSPDNQRGSLRDTGASSRSSNSNRTSTAMQGAYLDEDGEIRQNKHPASMVEQQIRMDFVRKVYAILSAQLLISFGFVCICLFVQNVKLYVQQNVALVWVAFGLSIFLILLIVCVDSVRYHSPTNYITLFAFTLVEAYLLGVITSFYEESSVLEAIGITAIIVVGLTIFTFQSKWDFSGMGPFLLAALLGLIVFGFIRLFLPYNPVVHTVYAALGALIFSLYIIYDTYLLLKKFSIDEYIAASINLYLDIVNLFLYILQLVGRRN